MSNVIGQGRIDTVLDQEPLGILVNHTRDVVVRLRFSSTQQKRKNEGVL